VHDFISEKSLKESLLSDDELERVAKKIVRLASENKSDDNLSCQLLRIDELPLAKEDEV